VDVPIPSVPDRLVPQPKAHAERRRRREQPPREQAHDTTEAHPDASHDDAHASHPTPHAHEDGVGERIDITA